MIITRLRNNGSGKKLIRSYRVWQRIQEIVKERETENERELESASWS